MEPFVEDVVAAAYDDTLTPDDRAVLIVALNAVPREKYENALSIANLHGMGREKAEARTNRLREALDALVEHVGKHDDSLPNGPLNSPYQRAVQALDEADGFFLFPDAEDGNE